MENEVIDHQTRDVNLDRFRKRAILIWLSLSLLYAIFRGSMFKLDSLGKRMLEAFFGGILTPLLLSIIISPLIALVRFGGYKYKHRFISVFWVCTCLFVALLFLINVLTILRLKG